MLCYPVVEIIVVDDVVAEGLFAWKAETVVAEVLGFVAGYFYPIAC